MTEPLRLALVGGPMYDALYDHLPGDAEIVIHADHPTLNARVDRMLRRGERIDVLSTHGKYVPNQARWLQPLQEVIEPALLTALEPTAISLCRVGSDLLCVPRNIDVRTLWWREDRMDRPPDSWTELLDRDLVFGFTGRDSGLFGMFFELVVGSGGQLFDEAGAPALEPAVARSAIETITTLANRIPDGPRVLADWRYDEVDEALGSGLLDCAAAWPGATASLRASTSGPRLRPAPYPAGSRRRVSYSGCHGWAIPSTCGDFSRAVALIHQLCSVESQRLEAAVGVIPARSDVRRETVPRDEIDADRFAVGDATISDSMISYPPMPRFPQLEDIAAAVLTATLLGHRTPAEATAVIRKATEFVARDPLPTPRPDI